MGIGTILMNMKDRNKEKEIPINSLRTFILPRVNINVVIAHTPNLRYCPQHTPGVFHFLLPSSNPNLTVSPSLSSLTPNVLASTASSYSHFLTTRTAIYSNASLTPVPVFAEVKKSLGPVSGGSGGLNDGVSVSLSVEGRSGSS